MRAVASLHFHLRHPVSVEKIFSRCQPVIQPVIR